MIIRWVGPAMLLITTFSCLRYWPEPKMVLLAGLCLGLGIGASFFWAIYNDK